MSTKTCTCTIAVPETADIATEMTLKASVTCVPAADLSGASLRIRDHTGAILAATAFDRFDGQVNRAPPLAVPVPDMPGRYRWQAQVGPADAAGTEPTRTDFTVTATGHRSRLALWDLPPAVEAGRPFTFRLGLKCSGGCPTAGWRYTVTDGLGVTVAAGETDAEIWPGSDGLAVTEVEATAPDTPGLHRWRVAVTPAATPLAHEGAIAPLRVRAVAPAAHVIRIEAVDRASGGPLPGISVVAHPYRARTGPDGIAEIGVARGSYSVFVSGAGYFPLQRELEVTADVCARAPMEAEPPASKDW